MVAPEDLETDGGQLWEWLRKNSASEPQSDYELGYQQALLDVQIYLLSTTVVPPSLHS